MQHQRYPVIASCDYLRIGARWGQPLRAAVFTAPKQPLHIEDLPQPELAPGQLLLRVRACGVCRTDLHIVEGELPPRKQTLVPGHQIVGDVVGGATPELPLGTRVGVSWIGGVDGVCPYCRRQLENLCDSPVFTGYTVDGGYAEYAAARSDFVFKLPTELDDLHAAPLLCAGIIGFRSLRVAGVERRRSRRTFWFWCVRASGNCGSALMELRSLCLDPRRFAP